MLVEGDPPQLCREAAKRKTSLLMIPSHLQCLKYYSLHFREKNLSTNYASKNLLKMFISSAKEKHLCWWQALIWNLKHWANFHVEIFQSCAHRFCAVTRVSWSKIFWKICFSINCEQRSIEGISAKPAYVAQFEADLKVVTQKTTKTLYFWSNLEFQNFLCSFM